MNEIGDPTMIVLPSQEQWANAYTFATPSNPYSGTINSEFHNYLVMVAHTNRTSGIIFDGKVKFTNLLFTFISFIYSKFLFGFINMALCLLEHV